MPNVSDTIVQKKPEQGPFYNLDAVALPAASAFTTQGYTKLPAEARRISVIGTYAKGASSSSGSCRFRVQWQIAAGTPEGRVDDVYETVIDGTTVTKATSFLENPEYVYSIIGPPNPTVNALSFRMLSCEVPVNAVGVRVLCAEVDTANPGTITVRIYTSDEI